MTERFGPNDERARMKERGGIRDPRSEDEEMYDEDEEYMNNAVKDAIISGDQEARLKKQIEK